MFTTLKNSIKLRNRGKNLPTIQCAVGTENMSVEDLAENVNSVLSALTTKYGDYALKSAFVKLSMGKPHKIGKPAEVKEEKNA
jgi:large subunit ribosomal protein L1